MSLSIEEQKEKQNRKEAETIIFECHLKFVFASFIIKTMKILQQVQ